MPKAAKPMRDKDFKLLKFVRRDRGTSRSDTEGANDFYHGLLD